MPATLALDANLYATDVEGNMIADWARIRFSAHLPE